MNVSPHDILTERKMPCPFTVALTDTSPVIIQYENLTDYVKKLNNSVMSITQQVAEILTKEQQAETSPVEIGSWVLRKVNKLDWSSPR